MILRLSEQSPRGSVNCIKCACRLSPMPEFNVYLSFESHDRHPHNMDLENFVRENTPL